jgi:hypothetical protein
VATATTDAPETVTEEASTETGTTTKSRVNVQVNLPVELKGLVDARAEERGKSTSGWVAALLAREFGYDLPPVTRAKARKYASEEERKQAATERQRQKNAGVIALIEAAKRGEIDTSGLSPEVKAVLGL